MARISVACVQLEARDLGQAEEALGRALERVDEAGRYRPEIILLPECTYPAYYLHAREAYHRSRLRSTEEILRRFGEKARQHRAYIALGLARLAPSGRLCNSIAFLNPEGEILGFYDKIFLWHFDGEWFEPGSALPIFDLPFGRVGLMICADGRMPEIARALALQGAQLILDATALVTSIGTPEARTNPQVLYMLPARAMENRVWIAVANKVGMEADSVLYCGRSGVIAPDGQYRAMGSPDREEIVLAEVDLEMASGPRIRPASDPLLTAPIEDLPVVQKLQELIPPNDLYVRMGLLQLRPYPVAAEWIQRIATLGEILIRQGASILVVSGPPSPSDPSTLHALEALSARWPCGLVVPFLEEGENRSGRLALYLLDRGRWIGRYRGSEQGDSPVYSLRGWTVGVLLDSDGWAPEIARGAMLRGAELLVWWVSAAEPPLYVLARTRADENRVFVALAAPPGEAGGVASAVFDPLGQPLATGVPGVEHGLFVSLFRPLTRHKEMAPGSHVVFSRRPEIFQGLLG
ncbi:carbon-nitrogen hydrolase family protein [Thermoflexus sp.]|uniref:carbon-nitrogen hydrolase family protein n=1 Tax=Thermoflexus sp. TaxID=1969742 RepID=UPI0025D79519|nr:carbon-nitrogen hydrolase family protein [Thermoflexus sp.]MDW8179886.1 carbon-nitrogen hydrolase family protein [Anaerolineae bacterium]MCS6963294.1 carbon-nitrogen hydrolase family protein [Thermoflexus sp.]MCS7350435.1 carbon-nitrogen hydrolase family protein [Thermoflexus sp.]MCX7689373.1 carbon-nitrogen hydrolase family protein [Thermoflexus sp.]MDW8183953.1 carbon-nitrogen hydrolase family protein [Anaerolineae bacterium]